MVYTLFKSFTVTVKNSRMCILTSCCYYEMTVKKLVVSQEKIWCRISCKKLEHVWHWQSTASCCITSQDIATPCDMTTCMQSSVQCPLHTGIPTYCTAYSRQYPYIGTIKAYKLMQHMNHVTAVFGVWLTLAFWGGIQVTNAMKNVHIIFHFLYIVHSKVASHMRQRKRWYTGCDKKNNTVK